MTRLNLLSLLLLMTTISLAQDYRAFTHSVQNLYSAKNHTDAVRLWNELTANQNIPVVHNDSVAFIYMGEAKSVTWTGDFNAWGYDKKFQNKGHRIPNTNFWILKTSFPKDARFDYKIVLNETDWILDPLNPNQQWSGVGGGSPNSELRMPLWKEDSINLPLSKIPVGKIEKDVLINSATLGYQITYSVYTPANYNHAEAHPIVYLTDGYEYMHERMGNMITVLNNLIYLKKIRPVIAVFIDHREPINRFNNRRMKELAMNQKYLDFVTEELIPAVEKNYTISTNPAERAILGASMGGLTAAFFAFSKPEVFGLAGIQSPSFWFRTEIYSYCDDPENPPIKTFLTTGTIHDTEDGARKMKDILDKNTCQYQYHEVNQGHSWGNWRDFIDDILIYFFPVN